MAHNESNLKKLLRNLGYRHYYVAQTCGINKDVFYGYVSGRRVPTRAEATRIARFLDVSVPEIFEVVVE